MLELLIAVFSRWVKFLRNIDTRGVEVHHSEHEPWVCPDDGIAAVNLEFSTCVGDVIQGLSHRKQPLLIYIRNSSFIFYKFYPVHTTKELEFHSKTPRFLKVQILSYFENIWEKNSRLKKPKTVHMTKTSSYSSRFGDLATMWTCLMYSNMYDLLIVNVSFLSFFKWLNLVQVTFRNQ